MGGTSGRPGSVGAGTARGGLPASRHCPGQDNSDNDRRGMRRQAVLTVLFVVLARVLPRPHRLAGNRAGVPVSARSGALVGSGPRRANETGRKVGCGWPRPCPNPPRFGQVCCFLSRGRAHRTPDARDSCSTASRCRRHSETKRRPPQRCSPPVRRLFRTVSCRGAGGLMDSTLLSGIG